MTNPQWLIWSNEYSAWRTAEGEGYTDKRSEATRYTLTEALRLCRDSDEGKGIDDPPDETMFPEFYAPVTP